jgi:AraC-like DNA-binding protein
VFSFIERPSAALSLRGDVRCTWSLHSDESAGAAMPIVPDGSVEIVLNLGDPVHELDAAGRWVVQPPAMMVGQPTRPVTVRPSGTLHLVGIRLQPWASRAFVAAPAAEVANRSVDIGASPAFGTLVEALAAARDDESRLSLLDDWLSRHCDGAPPRFVQEAVRRMQGREPLPSIRGLAAELGVTMRSLQRAFAEEVGLRPKAMQRISRLQRAIGHSRADESLPWAAIAARAGYFDEAHLNRDFRALAGCSPSQFAPRAESLTDLMLESRTR